MEHDMYIEVVINSNDNHFPYLLIPVVKEYAILNSRYYLIINIYGV